MAEPPQTADMTSGLLVLNGDRRIVYCSEDASSLLGLRPNQILGLQIEESLNIAGQDSESVETLMGVINGAASEPSSAEVRMSQPTPQELSVSAFPVALDPGGPITAVLVEPVTTEVQKARQWDATIAILAHELHNPLTVIKAYSEMLLAETGLNATQRKWLGNIRTSSDRIAGLGSGLVSAARVQAGNASSDLEHLEVGDAIHRVVDTLTAAASSHSFALEIAPGLPEVIANRFKFEQVLKNLLDNAVKYSPHGGRIIITANYPAERAQVVIGVVDQGIGIALEDQERIFSPNERVARVETENIWGAGLGLFIVKELVELVGGEVWVESGLDRGSSFFFSLPAAGR